MIVNMTDGQFLLKKLLSSANDKQIEGVGYVNSNLVLTPRATGRSGLNLCPNATKGCSASCFADYDRMAWPLNKRIAVARTMLLASDPDAFFSMLTSDLRRLERLAEKKGLVAVCRLNVVSDVPFETRFPALFTSFPCVQFMDYTKNVKRILGDLPKNYQITFSRSESNGADCLRVLEAGKNISVVFRKPPFPAKFWGYPVIDGDVHDFRFLDPTPCVVALKAKGKGARSDATGFVVDQQPALPLL